MGLKPRPLRALSDTLLTKMNQKFGTQYWPDTLHVRKIISEGRGSAVNVHHLRSWMRPRP